MEQVEPAKTCFRCGHDLVHVSTIQKVTEPGTLVMWECPFCHRMEFRDELDAA
jgi:transcription elongation factor Elf1